MPDSPTPRASNHRRYTVADARDQHGLVAVERIEPGETILVVEGIRRKHPTRLSVQIGDAEHVDAPDGLDHAALVRDYPWSFLNHSCAPNARVHAGQLVAVQPIASGHPITFDYDANEYEMATPFACRCGAEGCRGQPVRGFVHLSDEERETRRPYLAEHLLQRLEGGSGAPS